MRERACHSLGAEGKKRDRYGAVRTDVCSRPSSSGFGGRSLRFTGRDMPSCRFTPSDVVTLEKALIFPPDKRRWPTGPSVAGTIAFLDLF